MNKLMAPLLLLLSGTEAHRLQVNGIFDKVVNKMNEKDLALAQYQVEHQKNILKAQKQAELIAQGQLDQSIIAGAPNTIDDEISQNLDMIDSAPLEKLAGMKESRKRAKRQPGATLSGEEQPQQALVQKAVVSTKKKPKAAPPVEDDEARDDFEGFGSITELVKNKDTLVERTMNTEEFKQEMAQKEQAKQEAIAAEKMKKLVKQRTVQIKKNLQKKKTLDSAKQKIEAALNKAALKKHLTEKLSARKVKAAAPAAPVVEEIAQPAADEPSFSVSSYKQVLASVMNPKVAKAVRPKVEPAVVIQLAANSVADNEEEQRGFIGAYSSKVSAQQQAKIDAKQAEEQELLDSKPKIPHSASAPGHKGMLARAMEKDMKDQEVAEAKEKEELMQAALNDPAFKMQMESLEAQKAAAPMN